MGFGFLKRHKSETELREANTKASNELIERLNRRDYVGPATFTQGALNKEASLENLRYIRDDEAQRGFRAGDSGDLREGEVGFRTSRCANCGGPPDHQHGRHGCCGLQGCHMKLVLAHVAYGEGGVSNFMQRNWPHI